MSFIKEGTPQKMNIVASTCEICKQKSASCVENGKMVCEDCRTKEPK